MTDAIKIRPRVLAIATVDKIRGGPVPLWSVEVEGQPPHEKTRTYDIEAKTDQEAAFKGIDLFVDEMENLSE